MLHLITNPRSEVYEGNKQGVEFPVHGKVKAAIERHPAMLHEIHMEGCLQYNNHAAQNLQTHWWWEGMGAPPADRYRQQTPEPSPSRPAKPFASHGDNVEAQSSLIDNLPPGYAYSLAYLPNASLCTLDAYAKDYNYDKDCNTNLLTQEETSTV